MSNMKNIESKEIDYKFKGVKFKVTFDIKYPPKQYIDQVKPDFENIVIFHKKEKINSVLSDALFLNLIPKINKKYASLPKKKKNPSIYIVRIDDTFGNKGACWYYTVEASSEDAATKKAITKINKDYRPLGNVAKFSTSTSIPNAIRKKEIGILKYNEGDPRL